MNTTENNKIIAEFMQLEITQSNGTFLINGKKYANCNDQEQNFFNDFVKSARDQINRLLYVPPVDVEILR